MAAQIQIKRGTAAGIPIGNSGEPLWTTDTHKLYIGDGVVNYEIGATPGGSDTQVQFNDGGVFGGDSGFTYDKTTDSATLVGDLTVADEAYGVAWNGSLEVPTKNALYDKIETLLDGSLTATRIPFAFDANTLTDSADLTFTTAAGLVGNDSGGTAVDLRWEGDTNANLLFVDASADKIGIKTSAPTHELTFAYPNAGYGQPSGIAVYGSTDQTTNYRRIRMYTDPDGNWISSERGGTVTTNNLYITGQKSTGGILGFIIQPQTDRITWLAPTGSSNVQMLFPNEVTVGWYPDVRTGNVQQAMLYESFGFMTHTSGRHDFLRYQSYFTPTSGTATHAAFVVQTTINQTGGANGITRGAWINPTITAAADFRALETSVGNVYLNATSGNTGVGVLPLVKFHVQDTAEQLRLSYDSSNRMTATVGSTGGVTFDAVGSGASFSFSDVVQPTTNDGSALGTTALQWSDLFLAEGGVINWDNGDVTITQTGNLLAFAGATTAYTFDAPVRLKSYTVGTLPTGVQGDTAYVTDALAPTYLTAVVGGGAIVTPVFYDGTNWVAH